MKGPGVRPKLNCTKRTCSPCRCVSMTIKRHFPGFLELLGQVSDHLKKPVCKVEELLMAVVGIFLFKRCSRNHAVNGVAKGNYSCKFERLFGCRLPDLDTFNSLLKELEAQELEEIKRRIVELLLRAKVFEEVQTIRAYHLIGTDACYSKINML